MGIIGSLIVGIVFLVFIGLVFIYETLTWGLVLFKFWGWFVLPVFVALPALTFVQALGLMFVIGLFKLNYTGEGIKDEFKKNEWNSVITLIVFPWITLLFGWLAYTIWIV